MLLHRGFFIVLLFFILIFFFCIGIVLNPFTKVKLGISFGKTRVCQRGPLHAEAISQLKVGFLGHLPSC